MIKRKNRLAATPICVPDIGETARRTVPTALWTLLLLVTFGSSTLLAEEIVTIPAGTEVELELLHHLNSKYCPTGSAVYLRVSEDVLQDGQVVIRKGTRVTGKIEEASKSKTMGRAGSLNFTVQRLEAVDGSLVAVDATIMSKGRKRAGATVGMVVAFGLPGLFSKGRMAFAEKGTVYSASLALDREVDLAAGGDTAGTAVAAVGHGARITCLDAPLTLKIEKGKKLEPIRFRVTPTDDYRTEDLNLESLQLVQVDDLVLPKPVSVDSVSGNEVSFDGWSIMQFCDEGNSTLHFRGKLHDNTAFGAETKTALTIMKKEKKKG